ncbi:neurofilament medium polypeptide isoform X2 [Dunckerocampus dactyliophorus]|uniref:neurofilament medium polypeptide isoform X2 n=1 Tax=Dunckerocampus dactyliophorus TaxID=161453 RepID=UPI0024076F13|nr:neurofilament medium polypeptide isoform X2 [Dunckerocampus dactyliophorus]
MGSLKNETQAFDKEDGEHSHGDTVLEEPVKSTNQQSSGGGGGQTDMLHNASHADEKSLVETKDQAQLGRDGDQTEALPMNPEDDRSTATERPLNCGNDTNISEDKVLFPLPSTMDPSDPNSPAPFGQHHMRTQVSLEVVQCHSTATSPMTPPEGGHSFIFPSSLMSSGTVGCSDSKDAELQVGKQVEFCSVATSPMTPKTPSTTAFPVLTGSAKTTKSSAEVPSDKIINSDSFPESSTCSASAGSRLEGNNKLCKPQQMGSMDQDITILVTHYDNTRGEEQEESACYPVEPEMVKLEESQEDDKIQTSDTEGDQTPSKTNVKLNKVEEKDVTKPPVPESPAPVGFHNIRTQVSLEVVQCHSVATSPMTPPEGDYAFQFPSPSIAKDAEMQVGKQVEFRSVATAPMTPRTPTVTTFPEIRKEASIGENIVEEEEEEERQEEVKEKEEASEEKKVETTEEDNNCKEKSEEVVQEHFRHEHETMATSSPSPGC